MQKEKRKKLKYLWLLLPAAIIVAFAVILIINSTYDYDPTGSANVLAEGEKGVLTIMYDGADGKPESETVEYEALKAIELPDVTKKGYHFSGWSCNGLFVGNSVTLNSKIARAWPQFDKDYSMVEAPCALYTDEFQYTEYQAGTYPNLQTEVADLYLDGGFKATIYSEPNFAGEETKVYYTGMFRGFAGSMKIEAVDTEGVEVPALTDTARYRLLELFAPRIWWDEDEEFFATTLETAARNMTKELSQNGYMYYIEALDSPKYMNDYLHGDLQNQKAYAFAIEKEFKYLDLSYFVFTPYNKAKEIAGIQFGNHIGDWEHITVRLMHEQKDGKSYYRPVLVDYSAHSFRNYVSWDEIETVENTHPVAYTAQGSHGMWKDAGTHVYVDAKIVKLTDECSQGTAWDLWQANQMETFSYDALTHTGKGIGTSVWKTEFDLDYCSDAITRWGNNGWYPPIQIYPQLQYSPGGPQQKKSLNDYYTLNSRQNERY